MKLKLLFIVATCLSVQASIANAAVGSKNKCGQLGYVTKYQKDTYVNGCGGALKNPPKNNAVRVGNSMVTTNVGMRGQISKTTCTRSGGREVCVTR